MKKLTAFILATLAAANIVPATAQTVNLLAEKPIYPLGEAKTWTEGDESFTFNSADLDKLVAEPTNTSNVFLYPENGTLNTPENQAKGAQGFYIDMEESQSVGIVTTTWEGAAAKSYEIYLSDEVPTIDILNTEPTFTISGLGQYTEHTAVLPAGAKGRYLTFQVTDATNWGWGVKIRSIKAMAPQNDVLTTFKVSPTIMLENTATPLQLTLLNQFGMEIPQEEVEINISDNAVFENNALTITSGKSATITATMGDETLTADIYVAEAPSVPAATSIKTAIYTNTITDYNSTAEFTVNYNGGALNKGEIVFPDGEVARQFADTRCVFLSNSETTGSWNGNIHPSEEGYRNFCLDVFSGTDTQCTIEFEGVENLEGGHTYPFALTAGEWTSISVNVAGATKLNNLSIRFTEANMADILLANVYFSPAYIEGDETAPVLETPVATASMTSIELTLKATDDLNPEVYYSITDGTRTYSASGQSGEEVTVTITDLQPSTTYNITVTASDGLNESEPQEITVATTGLPDAPAPAVEEDYVIAIYSNAFNATEEPQFDAWGSTATLGFMETESGDKVLRFSNYMGQWGGIVSLELNVAKAKSLCIDIFGDNESGKINIAPVWEGASNTPNKDLEVKGGEWTSYDIPLSEFGFDNYGTKIIQIALTESTVSSFAVDNLYIYGDETLAGVDVAAEDAGLTDVYTLQGICIRRGVNAAEATVGLPSGIYIVGGRKIIL